MSRAVSRTLYRAAMYVRAYGFRVHYGRHGEPRCMCGAISSTPAERFAKEDAETRLRAIVGNVSAWTLSYDGWGADDAVAALRIAADIAYAEGA